MQYLKIADLASQYLFEAGEQTDHKFDRANYFGVQIAKQLNLHLTRLIQPARLRVRENKTCVLPADYAALHAVSLVRDDELVTLTAFPRLALDRAGGPAGNPGATQVLGPAPNAHPPANPSPEAHFGVGGGQNMAGHYRLDLAGGQLILAADVPNDATVYLEYLGSGIPVEGTPQVPLYVEQVVLSYLDWKMLPRSTPEGVRASRLEEHKRQMRIAERFKKLTTAKEILEVTTSHYSKGVR